MATVVDELDRLVQTIVRVRQSLTGSQPERKETAGESGKGQQSEKTKDTH